ncbi:hypothetical protein BH23ACT10_BH23ACT10_09820 [soil metagenome]
MRGAGTIRDLDVAAVIDRSRSLNEGAILAPSFTGGYGECGFVDPDKRVADFTDEKWEDLWSRPATKVERDEGGITTYEGVAVRIRRTWLGERTPKQKSIVEFLERAVTPQPCPECEGTGLNEGARSARSRWKTVHRSSALQDAAAAALASWVELVAARLVELGVDPATADEVAAVTIAVIEGAELAWDATITVDVTDRTLVLYRCTQMILYPR